MDFADWLKKIEEDIRNGIKESRSFGSYVGETICNNDRFYIWKKSGKDETKREGNTTITMLAPLRPELVDPIPIRLSFKNDWRRAYEDQIYIILDNIFRLVVFREEKIITETLATKAQNFEVGSEVAKRDALQEAINYIVSEGNYADILLVSPLQLPKLMHEKSFISSWNLPLEFSEKKGKSFIGINGELSVYGTPSISEEEGLLFERRQIKVRKTPLTIEFEHHENPKILQIREDLFAWSVEVGGVAKVTFRKD